MARADLFPFPLAIGLTGEETEWGHTALNGQLVVGIGTASPHVPEPQFTIPVPADDHVAKAGPDGYGRKRGKMINRIT